MNGKSEPYEIELTYLGNVDLDCLRNFNREQKPIEQILNSPNETYFLDIKRNGGMTSAERNALNFGAAEKLEIITTLDKTINRFLYLCESDIFEDVFLLRINDETKQRLGTELCEDLESAVKHRNKRYENHSPANFSKPF